MPIVKDKEGLVLKGSKDISRYYPQFGEKVKLNRIELEEWEALFLHEARGAKLEGINSETLLKDALKKGNLKTLLLARELLRRGFSKTKNKQEISVEKIYRGKPEKLPEVKIPAFYSDGYFLSLSKSGKTLYEEFWFGQYGFYKSKAGSLYLLDLYEGLYLKEKGILKTEDVPKMDEKILDTYTIFKDWREKGFVLKTGFKFGGDFRIYFPGTTPNRFSHSKHVLRVFPRNYKIPAKEMAYSLRVAHGVKKTYILALPKSLKKKRRVTDILKVEKNGKVFVVKPYFEWDWIKASELNSFLHTSKSLGGKPLLSIIDREGSLTLYEFSLVKLEGSENTYFEIKWMAL